MNIPENRRTRKVVKVLGRVVLVITSLVVMEMALRAFYALRGVPPPYISRFDDVLEKSWFVPHPYLVYTFKPCAHFTTDPTQPPLFDVNAFGFRSTGDLEVRETEKSANTIRIAAFGGSTTMGANRNDEIWPYLLGKHVAAAFPNRKIEVLNEGTMGYTSLDNLIDLCARVVDFNADVYVLYLGVNDYLTIAPKAVYRTDNSHFRKTLYEQFAHSPVESLPRWVLKSQLVCLFLRAAGCEDRRSLLAATGNTRCFRNEYKLGKNEELEADARVRKILVRNLRSMVGVIRAHNPNAMIVLPSFVHFENPMCNLRMNNDFRELAATERLLFVDTDRQMPRNAGLAYDYGHFTPAGDRRMAELLAAPLIEALRPRHPSDKGD